MAKKEKKVKAEKQTGSVGFFQSMRFKILLMTLIGVLLSIVISLGIIVPRVQSQTKQTNLNYLEDLANAYGELINKEIDMIGYNNTMNYSRLNSSLGEAGVEGMSTSYAYLVDAQGIMMYHPDESKIGSEVANSMVKGLVEKLMAGENLANQIDAIEYEYKGATKFASYRIGKKNDYILVVTVDEDEIFAELNSLVGLALIVGVVIFVLVALACVALTGYLFGPLTTLTNIINKLASLDLTKNQGTEKILKRKDEIGVIGSSIRSLRKEMSSMIGELSGESDKLLEANASFIEKFTEISENVSNVNVAVEEIAEGSTSQAQETTAAGEQVANIGNVIEVNVRNVEKLEETAHEMSELSEKAAATLESLQSINEQTSENIKIVSEQTNNTNASAAKIQEAVTLIQDIASQTNLLSLNASIEAARAGEAGRGFAVVAEEIRKLADDSAASANEINQIVEELIANSNQSVGKMAEVTQDAQKQVKELQSTIDSFDSLRTCVQEVSDASENIAEQMADLEKQKNIISGVVEQLAAISEENAASTEETSASMQTLSETVQQCQEETAALNELGAALTETVGKFKV